MTGCKLEPGPIKGSEIGVDKRLFPDVWASFLSHVESMHRLVRQASFDGNVIMNSHVIADVSIDTVFDEEIERTGCLHDIGQ